MMSAVTAIWGQETLHHPFFVVDQNRFRSSASIKKLSPNMASSDRFSLVIENLSKYCGSWRNLFAGIGLLTVGGLTLRSIWAVANSLNVHYLGARNVRYRLTQYGQWAVITGCTRGIGREFALLLASYGLDVILIARDETKLNELSAFIEEQYGVQTVRVIADFAQGAPIYDSIKTAIVDKEVGILINNVGVMYDYPEYFDKIEERRLWELVNVNMGAAQAMTHAVMNSCMVQRRKGLIVFVSSISALRPVPLMSAYGATKAYDDYLARCLDMEYKSFGGIHVQTLTPSYIATDMGAYSPLISQPSIISPSAAVYVREASWTLGRAGQTTGYFPHTILLWGQQWMPEWCWNRFITSLTAMFRRGVVQNGENGPSVEAKAIES